MKRVLWIVCALLCVPVWGQVGLKVIEQMNPGPSAVAFDPQGRLLGLRTQFVNNGDNTGRVVYTIERYDSRGGAQVIAGGGRLRFPGFTGDDGKATDAVLYPTAAFAVDRTGVIYTAELFTASRGSYIGVRKIGTDGYIHRYVNLPPGGSSAVLAVDAAGRLFVNDGQGIWMVEDALKFRRVAVFIDV